MKHRLRLQDVALLGGLLIAGLPNPAGAAPVNYDEAKVGEIPLPDPLQMADGQPVTNAAMWYQLRRPEILRLFQTQVYGQPPPRPMVQNFRVVAEDRAALNGLATRRDVVLDIAAATNGTALTFTLFLPNRSRTRSDIRRAASV